MLSGAHMTLFPRVLSELAARGLGDVVLFGGGIIPEADSLKLKAAGIRGVFTPGTSLESIVEWVRTNISAR